MGQFVYQRALMIGLGELGNKTVAQLRQTLPQSDHFVTVCGFHHIPTNDYEWSYGLHVSHYTHHTATRSEIREQYIWHLENRRMMLTNHLTNSMLDINGRILVYFFIDLQDPISALMPDIFHLVSYLLRTFANNPAVNWQFFVSIPQPNRYDAGQFATLREWHRFAYGGIAQKLFPNESPFAFLNDNHPVLFNRLLMYTPHQHLFQLWAEICLAQLQCPPTDMPDDDIYSHQFMEYLISNDSSRSQALLMHLTHSTNGISDDYPAILCHAFNAYSVALPVDYLYRQWQAMYVNRFLTHYLGISSSTKVNETLTDWLKWRNIPPVFLQVLNHKMPLHWKTDSSLREAFLTSDIIYQLPPELIAWQKPTINWKHETTTAFVNYYYTSSASMLGDIYATDDYPSGAYSLILTKIRTETTKAFEDRLMHQVIVLLHQSMPSEAQAQSGGILLILSCLAQLIQVLTPILNALQYRIREIEAQINSRRRLNQLMTSQLLENGHLSRFGRLLPNAEIFLKNQIDDIEQKKMYHTLCFATTVLGDAITICRHWHNQLGEWKDSLQILHHHLEKMQKSVARPYNTDFCYWIHDSAWEAKQQEILWQQHADVWQKQLVWTYKENQLVLEMSGHPLSPHTQPQIAHLRYWQQLVNLDGLSTNIWDIYAHDEAQGIYLFSQLKQLLSGNYQPILYPTATTIRLLLPHAPTKHLGEQAFMHHIQTQFATLKQQKPSRNPTGERITCLIEYEKYPLYYLDFYQNLHEKYIHFLNQERDHLFIPERTVITYEAYDKRRLLSAPIVALFEYEHRLNLLVLLAAFGYLCEKPLDDTTRYLGLQIDGDCLPLTKPSESPSWYDATYQFVWEAKTCDSIPRPLPADMIQSECDIIIAHHIQMTDLQTTQGDDWAYIRRLIQFRGFGHNTILRIGILLDIYANYFMQCRKDCDRATSPTIRDLYRAFMYICEAQQDSLKRTLRSYRP